MRREDEENLNSFVFASLRVAIYARVSTRFNEQADSIKDQGDYFRQFLEK